MRRFVFIVHTLSPAHRFLMGLRCGKWGLLKPKDEHHDPANISTICRFRYGVDQESQTIEGLVVAIPLLPEELIADQELALHYMMRAVKWAQRDGKKVDAIGLGSLCAVVAGRGVELQKRVEVPVTTGNAATAWTLYCNARTLHQHGPLGMVNSGSPVGIAVSHLLSEEGYNLLVDNKKSLRVAKSASLFTNLQQEIAACPLIIGCGPTGGQLQPDSLGPNTTLLDVALPSTISGSAPHHVQVYMGEAMSLAAHWKRGFWGPIYHLVAGYGWRTVLACLVEPLAVVYASRSTPFAQGRKVKLEDVREFGRMATEMGFSAVVRRHKVV